MSTNLAVVFGPILGDLSNETTATIVTVNLVALVGAISIFGIAGNVINISVFCKQGFSETTNMSYTALAISDLLSLVGTMCLSILSNPWFRNSALPLIFADIQAVFATMPYACFSRITGLATAFITFERCLCVVSPLKVKGILTPAVTVIVIVSIYLTMCLTMVPVYSTLVLSWRSEPRTNRTVLGLLFVANADLMSNISYSLHSVIQSFAFLSVLVCTINLIVCLRQKTRYRIQLAKTQNAAKNATKREDKAIKMVTLIAAAYLVCCLPTIVSLALTVLYPTFGPMGGHKNIFFSFWSFLVLCRVLNSSLNLPVYYLMSSKFRQSCNQIVSRLLTVRIVKDEDITTDTT